MPSEAMDGRYLVAAILLLALGLSVDAIRWTHNAAAWSIPFTIILLFLAFIGDSPAKEVIHWVSDEPLRPRGEH